MVFILPAADGAANDCLKTNGTSTGLFFGGCTAAGTVTGSGTTNVLTKWSNGPGSVLADSQITDNGTDVTVNAAGNINLTASAIVTSTAVIRPSITGVTPLGASNRRWTNLFLQDQIFLDAVITPPATTGDQTIDFSAGSVNFAAAATSLVVTSNKVTTSSIIICTVGTNDATLKSVQCVAAAGSFTMFANAAATAETRVNFWVLNQ